jgi:hypothetical protein
MRETEMKICHACQQTFDELFDAYSNLCPPCLNGDHAILFQADGVWVWKSGNQKAQD